MTEIQVVMPTDGEVLSYESDIIPRKNEFLSIQSIENSYQVTEVEHYIRPYGGTSTLVSTFVRIFVRKCETLEWNSI